MNKKARERAILRSVYDEKAFASIKDSERPDFVLHYPTTPTPFGVEVTELYFAEADARLRNIPGYMEELWAGGNHRHKDDKNVLRQTKATVTGPDGVVKAQDVPIIFRQMPPVGEYTRLLATAIVEKTSEASDYQTDLSHVNLIIMDRTGRLYELNREYIFKHVFAPEVRDALIHTSFREVFLVLTREMAPTWWHR